MEIRNGSSIVHIYATPVGKYNRWTIAWVAPGIGRRRKTFGTEKEARDWGRDKAAEISGLSQKPITICDKTGLNQSKVSLEPYGVSVERAIDEWIALRRECGTTIYEVMDFWKRHHQGVIQKTVAEAVDEVIEAKRQLGRSDGYLRELRRMLGSFADAFRINVSLVNSTGIDQWLKAQKCGSAYRKHMKEALSVLFRYCRAKHYTGAGWSELDAVETPTVIAPETSVFTPDEISRILHHSMHHSVPATAILAFAGLRPAEIERLDWADVGELYITVAAAKSKTASRRTIPIQPNLASWLNPHRPGSGRVWPRSHSWLYKAMHKAASKGGVQWRRNALRHSYCSYRLAMTNDASKVALEAGNSPQMIFRHYRALVTPEAAAEWFNVRYES